MIVARLFGPMNLLLQAQHGMGIRYPEWRSPSTARHLSVLMLRYGDQFPFSRICKLRLARCGKRIKRSVQSSGVDLMPRQTRLGIRTRPQGSEMQNSRTLVLIGLTPSPHLLLSLVMADKLSWEHSLRPCRGERRPGNVKDQIGDDKP